MKDSIELEPQVDGVVNVLQITDTHLFAHDDRTLLGINTRKSLNAVIDAVLQQNFNYDLILVTGDISQDYSPESYQYFVNQIQRLNHPTFVLPGNHDDANLMYLLFGKNGPINASTCIMCGKWQFVMLDSQVYGVPHGWLEHEQLDYLKQCTLDGQGLYTCVCVHHLPQLVGSTWLDTQTLHNQDKLNNLIRSLKSIRAVLSGHVHQDFEFKRDNVHYIASPSTSVQFESFSENFQLATVQPGWRYLRFNQDGSVVTKLYRLPEGSFLPDLESKGY